MLYVFMFFIAFALVRADLTTDLQHYYTFNDTSWEDNVGSKDFTSSGTVTLSGGAVNSSVTKGASGYMNTASTIADYTTAAFTYGFFFNVTAKPASGYAFSYDNGATFKIITSFSGGITARHWTGAEANMIIPAANYSTNKWYLYVVTYDGVYIRGYLDGVLHSISADTGTFDSAATPAFYIFDNRAGGGPPTANAIPNGFRMDDLRIYHRNLSAADVVEWNNTRDALANFTLQATDYFNGSVLSTFNTTVQNGSTFRYYSTTTSSIITGIIPDHGLAGVNITYEASNYLNKVYEDIQPVNIHTGVLQPKTSLNITYKDEQTLAVVTDTVTLEAFNTVLNVSFTNTTNSGESFITVIVPANYTLRYSALPNYIEKLYTVEVLEIFNYTMTLYMSNDSVISDFIATVVDQNLENVDGAEIQVLRFDPDSSSFFVTEIVTSNNEGKALFHAVLNEEFYKFKIYVDGELVLSTTEAILFDTEPTFQVNTEGDFGGVLSEFRQITYVLNFTNSTQLVYFEWNDPSNVVTEGCLMVYLLDNLVQKQLVNSSCSSSNDGSISLGGVNSSLHFYEAIGYVNLPDNDRQTIASLIIGERPSIGGQASIMYYALVQIIFPLMFSFSVVAVLIAAPIPLIGAYIINVVDLNLGVIIAITGLFWILAGYIGVRKNG